MKIDFFNIPPHQEAIHDRLENWARWVKPGQGAAVCPMFRMAKSNSRQWHSPEIRPTCNTLDAVEVEKSIRKLPKPHMTALRWYYVHRTGERKARQELSITRQALHELVIEARGMLV